MTQLSLTHPGDYGKEIVPILARLLTRASDPAPSKAGAVHVVKSGRERSECEEIVRLFTIYPWHTREEVCRLAGKDKGFAYTMGKRLAGLVRRNRLRQGPDKVCLVTKHLAGTWGPVEKGDSRTRTTE